MNELNIAQVDELNIAQVDVDAPISDSVALLYDPDVRRRLRAQDSEALRSIGYRKVDGVAFKVVTAKQDVTYLPFPLLESENMLLSEEEMMKIQGGGGAASTAGSLGSLSTFSCTAVSCFSTGSSVSTLGCGASAGGSNVASAMS